MDTGQDYSPISSSHSQERADTPTGSMDFTVAAEMQAVVKRILREELMVRLNMLFCTCWLM